MKLGIRPPTQIYELAPIKAAGGFHLVYISAITLGPSCYLKIVRMVVPCLPPFLVGSIVVVEEVEIA